MKEKSYLIQAMTTENLNDPKEEWCTSGCHASYIKVYRGLKSKLIMLEE